MGWSSFISARIARAALAFGLVLASIVGARPMAPALAEYGTERTSERGQWTVQFAEPCIIEMATILGMPHPVDEAFKAQQLERISKERTRVLEQLRDAFDGPRGEVVDWGRAGVTHVLNAVFLDLTDQEAAYLESLPGVLSVSRSYPLASPDFAGRPTSRFDDLPR